MTNKNFKEYVNTVKKAFDGCLSVKGCDDFLSLYKDRENETNLTEKQLEAVYAIGQARKDEIIAHNTAVAMADSKKGGKQSMSNKKKQNTETPADVQPAQTPEQPETAPAPVEVLKGEVIETKNEAEINAAIGRISTVIDNIGRGYLEIVGDVARLRKFEAWKLTGHKNLYELCADKFGMSKGTVHNLEVVFKKYGDPETFQLTDACAGMSLREMLQNIDAEKKAIAGEVAGEAADGDGNGGEATDSKKTKAQTIISVSYELAGDDWDADAILDEIRKQLEQNPDAKEAFPDGATVNFTISI